LPQEKDYEEAYGATPCSPGYSHGHHVCAEDFVDLEILSLYPKNTVDLIS